MKPSHVLKTAALLSVSLAALSIAACNKAAAPQNGVAADGTPNGAYVQTAYTTTATDGAATAPASTSPGEYHRRAHSAPPPIPDYDQPPIPGRGYEWTPGYWDWSDGDDDYYWVPGTWVEPPHAGLYWTPGYWRYYNGDYLFSDGYWGPEVGFYGGVDYGYGYGGDGYAGGRWQGDQFYYNSQVNNFGGRPVGPVYSQNVPMGGGRASFNGGPGGLRTAPSQPQIQAAQTRHLAPTATQVQVVRAAQAEPRLMASANHGSPPIAATSRPADFHAMTGVTGARSAATYTPPARRAGAAMAGQGSTPAAAITADTGPRHSAAAITPSAPRPVVASPAIPIERAMPDHVRATTPTHHTAPADHAARAFPADRAAPNTTRAGAPAFHAAPVIRDAPVRAAPPARMTEPMRAAPVAHAAPPAPKAAAQAPRAAPTDRKPEHP
jgi:hypothetical protein